MREGLQQMLQPFLFARWQVLGINEAFPIQIPSYGRSSPAPAASIQTDGRT